MQKFSNLRRELKNQSKEDYEEEEYEDEADQDENTHN